MCSLLPQLLNSFKINSIIKVCCLEYANIPKLFSHCIVWATTALMCFVFIVVP